MNGDENTNIRRALVTLDRVAPARTFWQIAAALLAKALAPDPSWTPSDKIPAGNSGGSSNGDKLPRGSASKAFREAYNRNAMNFVPGSICSRIYGEARRQSSCEHHAAQYLERHPDLLAAARARGYSQ